MDNMIITITGAVLASNALFAFIQFLITRGDSRRNIPQKLDRLEKDGLRTQLLLMILLKGDEKKEILTLGQHYFDDLKGNWYMTDIFYKWLEEKGHSKPDWFKHD